MNNDRGDIELAGVCKSFDGATYVVDGVNLKIADGAYWDCYFFNIAIKRSGSTITIAKHNCPDSAETYGSEQAKLAELCMAEGADGIGFTLSDGAKLEVSKYTSGGMVSWDKLPDGAQLTVTEAFPKGYGSASASCDTKASSGNESGYQPVDVSGVTGCGSDPPPGRRQSSRARSAAAHGCRR